MADASGAMTIADVLSGNRDGGGAEPERNEALTQETHQEGPLEAQDGGQPQGGGDTSAEAGGGQEAQPGQAPQQQGQERGGDAMVPSWRLREINEQRETERRERQAEQRELNEMRRWRQEQEQERQRSEEAERLKTAEFDWENPNRFVDQRVQHGFKEAVSPLQQQIQQIFQQQQQAVLHNARLVAGSVLGDDKVKAAEEAFNKAAQTGAIDADEHRRINSAPNPYEAAVRWHQRQSTLDAIGGDLEGYNKRQQDELLKNPEFLARALEAHRSQATPVQSGTGIPGRAAQPARGLPSLNRQTSAQDNAAEMNPQEAFQTALATGGRMPR